MMLPAIIGRYPSCRKVFDRYGLAGCGGALGPEESLEFFIRAHRADAARLIPELEEAARADRLHPAPLEFKPGPADVIYRLFFKAGILTMFTFGCVLGGINLAVMAARGELASLDLRAVTWAHAHAQIAGWVMFFVMGFAYQAIPRFRFTTLYRPRLATWTLPVMATALSIRTLAEIWISRPAWSSAGRVAGAAELAVVATFFWIIVKTVRQSPKTLEWYERFLVTALAWMVAAFAFDLWIFMASAEVSGYRGWVHFISLYDAPWRDVQLLGFAGGMILAVSQRFLPFIYGFREVPAGTARLVFWIWNLSVAGNIASYSLLVRTRQPLWGVALELSILGLLASIVLLVRAFRLFSARVDPDRSLPFLRAAYGWAIFAAVLLALLPVYDAVRGVVFSHAYFGGYRHAFTVGFISMMIVGVSSKVTPILGGLDPRRLRSLRASFWLINIGCAMRVVFQILTDSGHWAFPVTALSAWVEVAGLSLWAFDLWHTMNHRLASRPAPGDVVIAPEAKVLDVVERYPETTQVFLKFGFSMIENPVARQVFARSISLEQACRLKHVDRGEFIAALHTAARNAAKPEELVRISAH